MTAKFYRACPPRRTKADIAAICAAIIGVIRVRQVFYQSTLRHVIENSDGQMDCRGRQDRGKTFSRTDIEPSLRVDVRPAPDTGQGVERISDGRASC